MFPWSVSTFFPQQFPVYLNFFDVCSTLAMLVLIKKTSKNSQMSKKTVSTDLGKKFSCKKNLTSRLSLKWRVLNRSFCISSSHVQKRSAGSGGVNVIELAVFTDHSFFLHIRVRKTSFSLMDSYRSFANPNPFVSCSRHLSDQDPVDPT